MGKKLKVAWSLTKKAGAAVGRYGAFLADQMDKQDRQREKRMGKRRGGRSFYDY